MGRFRGGLRVQRFNLLMIFLLRNPKTVVKCNKKVYSNPQNPKQPNFSGYTPGKLDH